MQTKMYSLFSDHDLRHIKWVNCCPNAQQNRGKAASLCIVTNGHQSSCGDNLSPLLLADYYVPISLLYWGLGGWSTASKGTFHYVYTRY